MAGLALLVLGKTASASPDLGPLLPADALAIFDQFPFRVRSTIVPLSIGEQIIQWQCAVIELYHKGDWYGVHWTAINPHPGPHYRHWWASRSRDEWIHHFRRKLELY